MSCATGRIAARIGRAVDALGEMLDNAEAPPAAKISAARAILEYGLKYGELVDVTRRVDRLEALMEDEKHEQDQSA